MIEGAHIIKNEMIEFHKIDWKKVSEEYTRLYNKKEFTPITLTNEMFEWEIEIGYKNNETNGSI